MILLQFFLYGLTFWLEVIVILEWTPHSDGGVGLHLLNIGKIQRELADIEFAKKILFFLFVGVIRY